MTKMLWMDIKVSNTLYLYAYFLKKIIYIAEHIAISYCMHHSRYISRVKTIWLGPIGRISERTLVAPLSCPETFLWQVILDTKIYTLVSAAPCVDILLYMLSMLRT